MGPGDSWTVEKVESIAELELEAVQLVHKRSGAAFTHFIADDVVNAFSVNFKTTPMDSTGISHILEHVSLCGSRKFPVRDPFFKMLNRSLSTFMNAMTGPDYTLYPFSTPNERDYYNLMSVYLDAVFRPNLNKNDFRQEGWRLEPEDLTAPNSRPIIKGVVFNEMKGVYADPQQLFGRQLLNAILPSHTYGNCSGGIPEKIVDLTWEALRNFHSQHYSPHNARFFTYGNLPLEPHLEFVDQYLPKENAKSFKGQPFRLPFFEVISNCPIYVHFICSSRGSWRTAMVKSEKCGNNMCSGSIKSDGFDDSRGLRNGRHQRLL